MARRAIPIICASPSTARRAAFSAWYELFPRSQSGDPSRHGTFDDVIARLPYVRDLGFDVLYFPPIHPIGRTNRKGTNNSADRRARTIPAAPMPSAPPRAATTPIHPELGTLADFRRLVAAAARARPRGRARLRHPVLARPSLDRASIRTGSTGGPTARSSTPRTRRRNTRTSSTSISTAPRPPGTVARAARHRAVLGRRRACDLPRRQPAHQAGAVLGMADPRGEGRAPRGDLPRRGLHPAEDDAAARQGRLHPVLHLLHLAQHEARADRVPDRADHGPRQEYFRPNFFANTPDINPDLPADERPAGFRIRLVLAATLSASTASTTASSCARPRRSRARRNTSTPRNTRSRSGTGTGPATSRTISRCSTASAATTRRCSDFTQPRLLQRLERPHPASTAR